MQSNKPHTTQSAPPYPIAGETKQAQVIYDRLSGMSGPVSDALARGAQDLAKTPGSSNAIKQATYDAVRTAISETLAGRQGAIPARLSPLDTGGSGEAAGSAPSALKQRTLGGVGN